MKNFSFLFLSLFTFSLFGQTLQWEHTNGPNGGSVNDSHSNENFAYVLSRGQLFRTSDALTWESVYTTGIASIISGDNNKLVIVSYNNYLEYELHLSLDQGETWIKKTLPADFGYVDEMAYTSHGLYLYKYNKFYQSMDDGDSWQMVNFPIGSVNGIDVLDGILYIYGAKVWKYNPTSGDFDVFSPDDPKFRYAASLAIQGSNIAIGTSDYFWHSQNGGITWDTLKTPQNYEYKKLAFFDNKLYALGGQVGFRYSENAGITWKNVQNPYGYYQFSGFLTLKDQFLLTTYSDAATYLWDFDTKSLTPSNIGITTATVKALSAEGDYLWASTYSGLFKYDIDAGVWDQTPTLQNPGHDLPFSFISTSKNGAIVANTKYADSIYISPDNGQTWKAVANTDMGLSWNNDLDKNYVFDSTIFVASDFSSEIARSLDLGNTWRIINLPLDLIFSEMFEHRGKLWAFNRYNDTIYSSNNTGRTWKGTALNLPDFAYSISNAGDLIFASSFRQITGLQGYKPELYVSVDGINWRYANDGLPDNYYLRDGDGPRKIFECSGIYFFNTGGDGPYMSTDTCKTWFPSRIAPGASKDGQLYSGDFGGVSTLPCPDHLFSTSFSGTVYLDSNDNGVFDSGEKRLPNLQIGIKQTQSLGGHKIYSSTSDEFGQYALRASEGIADTVFLISENPKITKVNPPFYTTNSTGLKDFGLVLATENDLAIEAVGSHSPKPREEYLMSAKSANLGGINAPALVSLKLDPNIEFVTAVPMPSRQFGDSLIWEMGILPVLESKDIKITSRVNSSSPLNSPICSKWQIHSDGSDVDIANNTSIQCDTVGAASSSDFKTVHPAEGLTEAEILAGKEIFYTIYFQNTDSNAIQNVRITDRIDTALNLTTFRMVGSSHAITSWNIRPGGTLEVKLAHVNLPPASQDATASRGFIRFAIQRNKAFGTYYPVNNQAEVFYDEKPPAVTNKVRFRIRQVTSSIEPSSGKTIADVSLKLQPNPTNGNFFAIPAGSVTGKGHLALINTLGKVVFEKKITHFGEPIEVIAKGLPSGMYFVKISWKGGEMTERLIIQSE